MFKLGLRELVLVVLEDFCVCFDVVVCEGVGSLVEINLCANDVANMGFVRVANLFVLLVGDIDRGGVFGVFYGTVGLLELVDQVLIVGFVINKFRGDFVIFVFGFEMLCELIGRLMFGVLLWFDGLFIDVEDLLAIQDHFGGTLDVVVIWLCWMSNFIDVDAFVVEFGVLVCYMRSFVDVECVDFVVLFGMKVMVEDLWWLRDDGFDRVLQVCCGLILGVCGGY